MTTEVFAEWLRRQGHHVVRTESSYWYDVGPHVYQAFPYHWLIHPQEKELGLLFRQQKAVGLRYSTSPQAALGKISYHIICDDRSYDYETLPRKVRHDIRAGLDYARIEPIPIEVLANEGWRLRAETLVRQGRISAEKKRWWMNHCLSAKDLPGFEAWGAMHDGQLVSSFLACTVGDCYTLLLQQSGSEHLKFGVNNALYYKVTKHAMSLPGVTQLFATLESLDAPPSVDNFKVRIRFTVKPVRQRVAWHPWVKPFVDRYTHRLIHSFAARWPGIPLLAKTEGMIRFYLEGNRPLPDQAAPMAPVQPSGSVLTPNQQTYHLEPGQ